eukprot:Lankesteria_metandrocarpae@DN3090_c0_g1_i1.p1
MSSSVYTSTAQRQRSTSSQIYSSPAPQHFGPDSGTPVSYHPAGSHPSLRFSSALHPTYSPADVPTFEAPVIVAASPQVYGSWELLKQQARDQILEHESRR